MSKLKTQRLIVVFPSSIAEQPTEVIDFVSRTKLEEQKEEKSPSRLMEKLKRKRDEEFGKDE